MIGIQFQFPAKRYHATPWDRQVNEGAVEWPPAPWRILRALVATWYRKGPNEGTKDALRGLVETMSADAPLFFLPEGVEMHTRHYMPVYKGSTTKVFDTFLHITDDRPLEIVWPDMKLSDSEMELLDGLVERIGYLGRAESWVVGRTMRPAELDSFEPNASSVESGRRSGSGELVEVLAPIPAETYPEWRKPHRLAFEKKRRAYRRSRGWSEELSDNDRSELQEAVPETFFEALQIETSVLKEYGWNRPPGSRWLKYRRPRNEGTKPMSRAYRLETDEDQPTVARYRVAGSAPPRLTKAVVVGDRVRAALLAKSDGAPVYAGKDEDGSPLRGHRHVHVIPEALGRHGQITHVTLFAPMGFDERARRAIEELDALWGHRLDSELQLVLLGLGHRTDFAGTNRRAGHSLALASARVWRSCTPFIPTRHGKKKNDGTKKLDDDGHWIGGPRHDLKRILVENGYPKPQRIDDVEDDESLDGVVLDGKKTRWLEFRTDRKGGSGKRATYRGFGFEIEFPTEIQGPICAGYGAHYGLGRFEPVLT